jgi:hypothetical protein
MKNYLVEKNTGKVCNAIEIPIEEFQFNTETHKIVSTNSVPSFYINKWNGSAFEEMATPEEIAQFTKVPVPESVHAIAFMCALELIGITEAMVDAFIETLEFPNNIIVKNSFKRATKFHRDSPFIPLVGMAFQKTDPELDDVFINAGQISLQLNL